MLSELDDDGGVEIGALLDRTRSEDWARYSPLTSAVRERGSVLRRRRHVGAPAGVLGLAAVLVGGVSATGGLSGNSGSDTTLGAGALAVATPSATFSVPFSEVGPDMWRKVLEGSVDIGSGTLGSHVWSVEVVVFDSRADLLKAWPGTAVDTLPRDLPASGPVYVTVNEDRGKQGGIRAAGVPAQPPVIPGGKPAVVDPWYAANLGVVNSVVDPRVDHYAVTSGGTTTTYRTVQVKGVRFITFPVTGPGDVTRIVAYDAAGRVLDQKSGHFLPFGVFPYELPPTDPRTSVGAWD